MSLRQSVPAAIAVAVALSVFAFMPSAIAGCPGWGCQPACEASWAGPIGPQVVPCGVVVYPFQPAYRVEQGPIYNVVVFPYEAPRLRFPFGPPRIYVDCACYR